MAEREPTAERNQRGTYRIDFPRTERPALRVGEMEYEVLDLSESGLRYSVPADVPPPPVGCDLRGRVLFREEGEHDVVGTVARVNGHIVAVRFTAGGVPYATIFAEQRRLRRAFVATKGRVR
ncbi:MAG: PilZ domain-containing protein [Longimicrobiales bacterium]